MSAAQTETRTTESLNIHLIENKNFKTVTAELKLQTLLDRRTITELTLLPGVLRAGTDKYPTPQAIQNELDDLYGASLVFYPSTSGQSHMLNIQMEFANGRFIENEDNLDENIYRFLNELLFRPRLIDGAFPADAVEREKKKLKQALEAAKDDRASYANERLLDEMAPDELYSVHPSGYLEDLDKITPASLYAAYETLIRHARIDLFAAGDIEFSRTAELITASFTDLPESDVPRLDAGQALPEQAAEASGPKVIIETEEIQQAKLHIGCRTGKTFKDDDFEALMTASVLLGGHPGSLLFSTVREKHSLAYYIGADLDMYSDKLIIFCGIAPKDYDKTLVLIEQQLEALKTGDFPEESLEDSKSMLVGSYETSLDSIPGMIATEYQKVLTGTDKTPLDMVEKFKNVTKEDIKKAAAKLTIDTTFFLTAKEED